MSDSLYPKDLSYNRAPTMTRATPPVLQRKRRCPFYSRAWRVRCDDVEGHHLGPDKTDCCNEGDSFAPGFIPGKGETL